MPMSGMKVHSLVVFSNHSTFHRGSTQSATLLLLSTDKLMSCCALGTIGCLDLRCRALPLDGQVSTEWSRCPDSMVRCAKDSEILS